MNPIRLFVLSCAGGIASLAAAAHAENDFCVGVEGFRDRYEEANHLRTTTDYGSVLLGDKYDFGGYFLSIDGRYSRGDAD